jgi:hypothetical protein
VLGALALTAGLVAMIALLFAQDAFIGDGRDRGIHTATTTTAVVPGDAPVAGNPAVGR